ncbi:protoporphyrinogen/coproporphyrinogen oxidase [Saccharopolyspora sp. CA-218241]|uniref:protoporphyrinogen/coproporphyrinogen oxidase n=1 Tax=Saccharopolyspora sp. CA-218241 TaxID=3240027 RepID=UPI003D98F0C5
MSPDLDVAVVGAGMAGLTAASELAAAGLEVRVFESDRQVGGRMAAFRHGGYTVDTGAEQISPHGYRATWQLLERLGVSAGEVPVIGRPLAVWRNGRARPGAAEPRALLTGAGLSRRARLDLARFQVWAARRRRRFDTDRPERGPLADLTVAEFARRYHPDLHDYLFQPVSGAFFGWDTARSSAAVMVSLLLAVGDAADWRTYRDGMDTPARLLAERLDVRTGRRVREVAADGDGARLVVGDATVTARAVLLCVPAPVARRLHANPAPDEARYLDACTFTPALKVSCLLDRPIAPPGESAPYLVLTPHVEEDVLSAIIVDHRKHPGRAPAGKGLLSLMPRAATTADLIDAPDREIVGRLTAAVERYVPGFGSANRENFVHRFRCGLPEATPEALRRRPAFTARELSPVDYAGDWVSLRPASEGAVRSGALAASRVLSRLRATRRSGLGVPL